MVPTHYSMRSATLGAPNRKDYIEELTKQLDACQKVGLISFILGIQTHGVLLEECGLLPPVRIHRCQRGNVGIGTYT